MNSKEILNLTKKGLLTWKKNWLFNQYTTHDYGITTEDYTIENK